MGSNDSEFVNETINDLQCTRLKEANPNEGRCTANGNYQIRTLAVKQVCSVLPKCFYHHSSRRQWREGIFRVILLQQIQGRNSPSHTFATIPKELGSAYCNLPLLHMVSVNSNIIITFANKAHRGTI